MEKKKQGVGALVAQLVFSTAVNAVILSVYYKWRPRLRFHLTSGRSMMQEGGRAVGVQLMMHARGHIDKLIVGVAFGAASLGYYYIAQRVVSLVAELASMNFQRVAFPVFSRTQNDRPRLNAYFLTMTFGMTAHRPPTVIVACRT